MLTSMRFVLLAAALAFALLSHSSHALSLGTPYGANGQWAPRIGKAKVRWYHHWQMGVVPDMPKDVQYVPMMWGPRYNNLWAQRKKWIHKHKPKYVLSLNEPDVQGQANVSPKEAVRLHMKELEPLRKKGIKVSTPQIVWNTNWLDSFMKELKKQGGGVDFVAAHYYGTYKDVGRFQKWVKKLRSKYHMDIWMTEYGVTASSGGSASQIKSFQRKVNAWMRTQSYVKRAAWLGCFPVNNPPDDYASRQNALFTSNGKLRSIGYQYVFGSGNNKRDVDGDDEEEQAHVVRDLSDARSTPGARRHSMQHHRRIIGLQQAADVHRRNETVIPTTINGVPATPEEVTEYLETLAHAADEDTFDEEEDDTAERVDCDEYCRMRDGEVNDIDLDDDDKRHQ